MNNARAILTRQEPAWKVCGNSNYQSLYRWLLDTDLVIHSEEFRLGAYIFGLLSIIPFAFFVLFIASVFFVTTVLTSFVWTFFICSALMIGLMVLVPLLFGFSIIAGFLIVGYYVYKQTKAKSN
jgi:hypothetical protein